LAQVNLHVVLVEDPRPYESKAFMLQVATAASEREPETKSDGSTAAVSDLASSQGSRRNSVSDTTSAPGSTPRLDSAAIAAPEVLSLPSPVARQKWCDIVDGVEDFSDVSPVASPKKGQRPRRRRRCREEEGSTSASISDFMGNGYMNSSLVSSPYPTAGPVGRGCWMPVGFLQPAWPGAASVSDPYGEVQSSPCHARNNQQGSVTSTVPCEDKLQTPKPELPRAPGPVSGPLPPGPVAGSGSPSRASRKGVIPSHGPPGTFTTTASFSDASARTPKADVPASPSHSRFGGGMSPMASGLMSSSNSFQDASARVAMTRVVAPQLLGVFGVSPGPVDAGPYPNSPTRVRQVPSGIVSTEPVDGGKCGSNSAMDAASPVADTLRNWLGNSTITSAEELAEKLQAAAPEAYED